MANKFNVFVYDVWEESEYDPYTCDEVCSHSISADFVDADANTTSCRIVNISKYSKEEVLNIDNYGKETPREFAERLLAADEFYIELRCNPYYVGDFIALEKFAGILMNMVGVVYEDSEISITCNRHGTPRYVEKRDAPREYWDEQKMKNILSKLSEVGSEFETLCGESHVQQINLVGGKVDVSEVLTSLETMRANIFDKLDSSEKQQAVA